MICNGLSIFLYSERCYKDIEYSQCLRSLSITKHETYTFITVVIKVREEQLDLDLGRNSISAKIKGAT